MGINVACRGLSWVVDDLFSDLKGKYVFNFLDDLLVYTPSAEDCMTHLHEVLGRLRRVGFTLNPDKVTCG
jgi:hypothetical protein